MSYQHNASSNLIITTSGAATISNGGGSYSCTAGTSSSSSIYTLTGAVGAAGGGGGGGSYTTSWGGASYSITSSMDAADVYISRPDGRKLAIGKILETIIDTFQIIEPDDALMSKYPALKEAYDEHQRLLMETFGNGKIRDSYETYQTIKRLVSEGNDE